jgi:hypothetical protein
MIGRSSPGFWEVTEGLAGSSANQKLYIDGFLKMCGTAQRSQSDGTYFSSI